MSGRSPVAPPARPRDGVEGLRRTLPAVALRGGAAGAGLVALGAELYGRVGGLADAPGGLLVALIALALLGTVYQRPASPAGTTVAGIVILLQLSLGSLDPRAVVAALAVHAMLLLAGLAAHLPADSDVEVAALAPSAKRFAAVSVLTAAVAAVAAVVQRGPYLGDADLLVLGLAAIAAVATVVVQAARRARL